MSFYFSWLDLLVRDQNHSLDSVFSLENCYFQADPERALTLWMQQGFELSGEVKSLAFESAYLFMGQSNRIFSSTEDLDVSLLTSKMATPYSWERFFFRHLSAYRMGEREHWGNWDVALLCLHETAPGHLRARILVEQAASLMNQGRLKRALAHLPARNLSTANWDKFLTARAQSVEFGCLAAQGQHLAARKVLERMRPPSGARSPSMALAHLRRKLTLAWESENLADVETVLALVDFQKQRSVVTEILILQTKIRLHLLRGEVEIAREVIHSLSRLKEEHGLAGSFLSDFSEISEVLFAGGDRVAIESLFSQEFQSLVAKSDDVGLAINHKMMRSRLCVLQGDLSQAMRLGIEAVQIAEEEDYGVLRLNALFQLAAVYFRSGDSSQAKACFARVIELSCRLQLFRSRNAARYLSASYILGIFSSENMTYLLDIPGSNFIVARFSSQIVTSLSFALLCQDGPESRVFSELRFREMVLAEKLIIWWRSNSKVTISTISGGRLIVRDLSRAAALVVVLDAFFDRRELSLGDVHFVKHKTEFRPERHGPACLSLIHRLRGVIEPELSIHFDRGSSKCLRAENAFSRSR